MQKCALLLALLLPLAAWGQQLDDSTWVIECDLDCLMENLSLHEEAQSQREAQEAAAATAQPHHGSCPPGGHCSVRTGRVSSSGRGSTTVIGGIKTR
jgi:hypothetical protein